MLDRVSFIRFVDLGGITETIIFVSYILVCAGLFKSRFSRSATVFALGAAGAVIAGANIAVMLSDTQNLALMLTLFPLTAYLPFSVLLYFLSDGGVFETAAVCVVGTLEALILKALQKILTKLIVMIVVNAGASYLRRRGLCLSRSDLSASRSVYALLRADGAECCFWCRSLWYF